MKDPLKLCHLSDIRQSLDLGVTDEVTTIATLTAADLRLFC